MFASSLYAQIPMSKVMVVYAHLLSGYVMLFINEL